MDKRQRLERGSILSFPGMQCCIEEEIGRGSNAIVYKGWYRDQLQKHEKHHVLIKELFPYHKKGSICRDANNRISVEEGESLAFFLMHRESFETGNRIHLRLLQDCPEDMGANLNSFELNGTLYTILGCSGGKSLEEELALLGEGCNLRRCVQLTQYLLDALQAFHASGYLHLDISPDNILLIGRQRNERMMLIDYNSARRIDDTDYAYLSRSSYKDDYSAPEVRMAEEDEICEASDLYSVAAVFYRMLMGRTLTLDEMLASTSPQADQSTCLENMPQTVKSLVSRILRKGLHTLPEERYQTIEQMRRDFTELIDRIDCVGVTHWALWECGKRSIDELIRTNLSLSYIKDNDGMYPIRLEQDGRRLTLNEYLDETLSAHGKSRLTISPGGMGKTTLLLKTALLRGRSYAPGRPAVFYISLAGFSGADPYYIRKQILASMRYKRENNEFESALHELEQLLGRTIKSSAGELPMVLLLLDGLNETRGDTAPLMQEINQLSAMAGVRMIAASRSEMPVLTLETNRILSLTFEDVQKATAARGVLLPQSETLLQLIRTPLILSIYLTAAENSQQLSIRDQNDLMKAYMKSLYDKEVRDLPDNSPQRWQTDAALAYVLPAIAAQTIKSGKRLEDKQLLGAVEMCYKVLNSKVLVQAFPKWIGRSRDILGDTCSAEEWYGQMVHHLLWERLGLLMKDEDGKYGVFHQMIAEYLSQVHEENTLRIRKWQRIRGSILGIVSLLIASLGLGVYALFFMVTPYKEADAEYVLSKSRSAYDWYLSMYEEMQALLDQAGQESTVAGRNGAQAEYAGYALIAQRRLLTPFEKQYAKTKAVILGHGQTDGGEYDINALLQHLDLKSMETVKRIYAIAAQKRKVVSWSGMALDGEGIVALYNHLWDRQTYYADVFLPELKRWYYGSRASDGEHTYLLKNSELYLKAAQEMVDYDAQVCQILYDQYLSGHMTTSSLEEFSAFSDLMHRENVLEALRSGVKMAYETSLDEKRDGEGTGSRVVDVNGKRGLETALNKVKLKAIEQKGRWDALMDLFEVPAENKSYMLEEQIRQIEEKYSDIMDGAESELKDAAAKYRGLQ